MKILRDSFRVCVGLLLACVGFSSPAFSAVQEAPRPEVPAIVAVYADLAHAVYEDSLISARNLKEIVGQFLLDPTEEKLKEARDAWIAARVPYEQSEVFRFGNPVVDAWEIRVNAWPLDEGFLDYVSDATYCDPSDLSEGEEDVNPFCRANIISSTTLNLGGKAMDLSQIHEPLIFRRLHQMGGIETNVASGYHAIEFLLWGQDAGGVYSGQRPATDFDLENCTGGHCERRASYLKAVIQLLIQDLEEMVANWKEGGAARNLVTQDPARGLQILLKGMETLSGSELAGERMKLGLLLHDPEEEQDCFSDNTHESHYYAALGVQNVYLGRYVRLDGSSVEGESLSSLVRVQAPDLDSQLRSALEDTMQAMQIIRARAQSVEHYDLMIAEGNPEGNGVVQNAIGRLLAQSALIVQVSEQLNLAD